MYLLFIINLCVLFCQEFILVKESWSVFSLELWRCFIDEMMQSGKIGFLWFYFSAITFTEFIVCVKFGAQIFKQTQMLYVLYWLIFQVHSVLAVRMTLSNDYY